MLEKAPWQRAPDGVFSSSDSDTISSNLASENTSPSSHGLKNNNMNSTGDEICGNDAILGDKITDLDAEISSHPIGGINHASNHLNFFENAEDKDSSDFLYSGLPEIENFEDVDRMFWSCDSTFGLGARKGNELDWFSSEDNIGGSGDVMNSEFKFSCPELKPVEKILPDHDPSRSNSFNDSALKSVSYTSSVNGPVIGTGKDGFIPKTQVNEHQKQVDPQNLSEGKRKEHDLRNGHVSYMNKLPNEVIGILPSGHIQQQQDALGSDPCNLLQNSPSYRHSDNSPLSNLTSVNLTSSSVKSETTDLTSASPRDSSHSSNQLPPLDGSHETPLPVSTPTESRERDKLHDRQDCMSFLDSSLKHTNAVLHFALDPGSIAKEAQYPGAKSENHTDTEGGRRFIPAELGSSNVQESSMMSSGTDDISPEAASFRQFQLVTEQLDLRTKICIRDSLYRLARSAEQRHNHADLNGSCGNGGDATGSFMAVGENRFMDIETETNPVDRSVAHLLFHRPTESSPVPTNDLHPFKTRGTIFGSVTSPRVVVDNSDSCEELPPECFNLK